jgi:uncharacterized protein (DUF1684 family)
MKLAIQVRGAVERMRPYHPPLEGRGGKMRLDFNLAVHPRCARRSGNSVARTFPCTPSRKPFAAS